MADVDRFRVVGGTRLVGEVAVGGAKNSALKLMAAATLAPGRSVIDNVPEITDCALMGEVLRRVGCDVIQVGGQVTIDVPAVLGWDANNELVRRLRASVCVLGPLLARTGRVAVAQPGGDAIGNRGLDMHISGLRAMGASVTEEAGVVRAVAPHGLSGAKIWLDFPSVGATENLLMAAVLAAGTTELGNVAREPEIVDLGQMLIGMGAKISGLGSATLIVDGVTDLVPVQHRTVGDRIVAGTWAYGAAMTHGDVRVTGIDPHFLDVALEKIVDAGGAVEHEVDAFRVRMDQRPKAVDIVTLPYPGFATDLLPMAIGLATVSEGTSLITENIFDGRFMFINELNRMGADVRTDGHHASVRGHERLHAAHVQATDIRAGAGLVLAGLCAQGVTEVAHAFHVDRGYPSFISDLRALGADIDRVTG
jgi:UDP-N-acetylglucosamine 1-carboxyvinyltransferase